MYAVGEIGLAKISLISLSEIAAKCNASPVGKRTVSPLSMNPRTRDVAEGEEKKSGRDVKIRRNEKRRKGVERGKQRNVAGTRELESVRVFQIFYFYSC